MIIKLRSSDGNAIHLISIAKDLCKQTRQNEDDVIAEMIAGDYNHLLEVFKKYFADLVEFV